MTDESYIKKTIEQLKKEKAQHVDKFAGNHAHAGCAPNFDRAIKNLENEEYLIVSKRDPKRAADLVGKDAKNDDGCKVPRADEPADYTEAGDIGDEQMPAGDIKTDKKAWNLDASKNLNLEIPKKVKEFMDGL